MQHCGVHARLRGCVQFVSKLRAKIAVHAGHTPYIVVEGFLLLEVSKGSEAGSEAGTEAGTEAGSEAGSEAGTEAGSEAGSEAGTEASTEAGTESSMQAGRQAGSVSIVLPTYLCTCVSTYVLAYCSRTRPLQRWWTMWSASMWARRCSGCQS